MSIWRDWIDEHWEGIGMAVSVGAALAIAVLLALAFNVITTRFDGVRRETAYPGSPVSDAARLVNDTPAS